MIRFISFFVLFNFALSAVAAFAGGGSSSVGGGDGIVILKDDTVRLADHFVVKSGAPDQLPRPLLAELARIDYLLSRYGVPGFHDWDGNHAPPEFHTKFSISEVVGRRVRYRFVDTLPDLEDCSEAARNETRLPAGATLKDVACTLGPVTWIVRSAFLKLSLRDQALLVIHERLHSHAIRSGADSDQHLQIAEFVQGLEIVLGLYQEQKGGVYRKLTRAEIGGIELLRLRILTLDLRGQTSPDYPNEIENLMARYAVVENGGGLIRAEKVWLEKEVFVGVGSLIEPRERALSIRNSVYLVDSVLETEGGLLELESGFTMIRSTFHGNLALIKAAGTSRIVDSAIAVRLNVTSPLRPDTPVVVGLRLGENATIEGVKWINVAGSLNLGKNASLRGHSGWISFNGVNGRCAHHDNEWSDPSDHRGEIDLTLEDGATVEGDANLPLTGVTLDACQDADTATPEPYGHPVMVIKANSHLDLKEAWPICFDPKKPYLRIHGRTEISSVADLQGYCAAGAGTQDM